MTIRDVEYWEKITDAEKGKKVIPRKPKTASYSNAKRGKRPDLGTVTFRSSWEANYARILNLRVADPADPLIRWEFEPQTFWFTGIKRGTVSYLPDFKLYENGVAPYFHEVKGYMDAKSRTKLRRMKIYHPGIVVEVIDSKTYKELEKIYKPLVPTWESPVRPKPAP